MPRQVDIEDSLRRLPLPKRIAFGASCSERMLPNYLAFNLMETWGDYSELRRILDKIWTGLLDESLLKEVGRISTEELIRLAPDTEEFSTVFTPLAGDAVASIAYTIQAFQDQNTSLEKLLLVVQVAQNSVFEYLSVVNDPDLLPHIEEPLFEERIFELPLMLAELEKERQDLVYLDKTELNAEVVNYLQATSLQTGIQPIRRGLVKA